MTRQDERTFGIWTEYKLLILGRYLEAFLTAAQGEGERIYLDLFAGSGSGVARSTGERFSGSARIAKEAAGSRGHQFTRLLMFETHLATQLGSEIGEDKRATVIDADCNAGIRDALATIQKFNWAPTFAFVDPDGLEIHWETLRALAPIRLQAA